MKTHFAVVLVALAFTHVTSTLPALPRRGGQTTPRRIVKKVGQPKTLLEPCRIRSALSLGPVVCSLCFVPRAQRCVVAVRTILSVPSRGCPLADDSFRWFEVPSCKRGSIVASVLYTCRSRTVLSSEACFVLLALRVACATLCAQNYRSALPGCPHPWLSTCQPLHPLPGAVAAGRRLVREASLVLLRHMVLHIAAPS